MASRPGSLEMAPSPQRSSSDSDSSVRRNVLGEHSTSALILVHDEEIDDAISVTYSDEDEDGEIHLIDTSPELVLSPSIVFGYFLSPCLKLGAMLILSSQTPLKMSLPTLLIFSFLSVFARQIWFLLARYLRKSDVGDIVAEALAKGRNMEGRRSAIKSFTRSGSAVVRTLLCTVYLKDAIRSLEPVVPDHVWIVPTTTILSLGLVGLISPLCMARSFASKRLIYSTALSNALYVIWLCVIIYAHAKGSLDTDTIMLPQGRLFQDITTVAFTFSSSSTVQLYAGMMGSQAGGDKKEKRYLSISSVSLSASLLGTVMVLPLLFPEVKSHRHDQPTDDASLVRALTGTLASFILILAIPPLIATSPAHVPPSIRRLTHLPVGKYSLVILIVFFSLLPAAVEPILEDLTILLVLSSTYFLPAFLHIVVHNVRRPLSILVPQQVRRADSDYSSNSGNDPETEELLLRKERALQRRRLGRRLLWDFGVWTLLIPIGGGGFVWAIGRRIFSW